MNKLSYAFKNTLVNMKRSPLLVFATIIAILVSSFLVFTTISARTIVENNTLRWQNGTHVVIFLDDRVTTTAHKQLTNFYRKLSRSKNCGVFYKVRSCR